MKHGLGKWRAVALDLDRTTLTSSHTLTPRTLAAIRQVDAWLAMKRDVSFGGMSDSSMAVCITRMRLKRHEHGLHRFTHSCCNHSTNSPCSPVSQHLLPSSLQNNHSAAVEPHCSATWLRNKQEQLIGNLSDIISELFCWPSQQAYFWHLLTFGNPANHGWPGSQWNGKQLVIHVVSS